MKRLFLILIIFCAVFSVSAKNNESLEYLKNSRKTAYRQKTISGDAVEMQEIWGMGYKFEVQSAEK